MSIGNFGQGKETGMKRIAVAAVALIGVSTLSGAAVSAGTATADNTGDAKRIHTKRLVLTETGTHEFGPNRFAGADTARSAGTHKIVGYDTYSGTFFPKRPALVVHVALALKGGIILGTVTFNEENEFAGPIVSGVGTYRGIEGRIRGHSLSDDGTRTFIRLRYHF